MSFNLTDSEQTITAAGARGDGGLQAGTLSMIVAPAIREMRVS